MDFRILVGQHARTQTYTHTCYFYDVEGPIFISSNLILYKKNHNNNNNNNNNNNTTPEILGLAQYV